MNDQQKRALIYVLEKGGETNAWYDVASPAVVKTMLDDGLIYQSDNRYILTGKGKEVALEAWQWQEAISRGLHHKINRLIREKGEDW